MAGPRVRQNHVIPPIRLVDYAPTIAHLFELDMKDMEGRVLHELFH